MRGETTWEELEGEAEAAEKLFERQGERTKTIKIENIVYKLSEREYNKFMEELKDRLETVQALFLQAQLSQDYCSIMIR